MDLSKLSHEELLAFARQKQEEEQRGLTASIGMKGGITLRGVNGRFGVTMYTTDWAKIFARDNEGNLVVEQLIQEQIEKGSENECLSTGPDDAVRSADTLEVCARGKDECAIFDGVTKITGDRPENLEQFKGWLASYTADKEAFKREHKKAA